MPVKSSFDRILMIALVLALVVGGAITLRQKFGGATHNTASAPEKPGKAAATAEKGDKAEAAGKPGDGAPLPDAVFTDAFGGEVRLSDFKGRVVLVNLWATWCPPCVDELPSLERLETRLRGRGLSVVAISLDKPPYEAVDEFLQKRDILQLTVYRDEKKDVQMKWKYSGLPSSFLLDREGNVVKVYEGAQTWDTGPVFDEIFAMLKER